MSMHRTYFMKQELYDVVNGSAIQEAPYNSLTPEEWLKLIHHQHAHEVEGISIWPIIKGRLHSYLMELPIDKFLFSLLEDYLSENNYLSKETKSIQPPESTLIPRIEWDIYKKAAVLYERLKPFLKVA